MNRNLPASCIRNLITAVSICLLSQNVQSQKLTFGPVAEQLQTGAYNGFYNSNGPYYNQTNTGNTSFNYWWQAHGVDALLDGYLRNRTDIYKTRAKSLLLGLKNVNGGVYPTTFYDDMAWLAIASLRGYENTGDTEYLNAANALWTDMKGGQHSAQGGALQWNKSAPASFNACTNGPAIILATRLARVKGTTADLETAKSIYTWMKATLVNASTGEVWDNYNSDTNVTNSSWIFSYNQGTWIGAGLELYKATGIQSYLDDAVKTANTAIKNNTAGILYAAMGGGDGGLFNGIFIRYLAQLAREGNLPQATRDSYTKIIRSTAQAVKDFGINKSNNTVNSKWAVAPGATTDYSSQLSGIMLLEAASSFDQVACYANATYGGKMGYLSQGSYTLTQMIAAGLANDNISSLTIPSGLQVVAYSDDNFTGDSIVYTTNQPVLDTWDNKISSIRIKPYGYGTGLKGEYYTGAFGALKFSQTDETVNFDWAAGSPNATTLGTDNFSVRWSGLIQPLYSGEYTFYVTSDDGARLTVNKGVLFDSLAATGSNTRKGIVTLEAGQKYDITLEYAEATGNAACKLEWESSRQPRQVVPKSQLYLRGTSTTDVVTAYAECNNTGFYGGLKVGDYTQADLNSLGILNNDISSLKVNQGFKVTLFDKDNFSGDSISLTADTLCLGDWADRTSSVRVRTNGIANMEGIYYLQNKNSLYNLDVAGGYTNTADGAALEQNVAGTTTNQQFRFTPIGNGTYSVTAMHSGKPVEVANNSKTDGAAIQQMTALGGENQLFILVPGSAGYYKLVARNSGKVLEAISSISTATMRQWTNTNQARGQWKMTPVVYATGTGTGLNADYFNGANFETARLSRVDTTINFNWGTGSPSSMVNTDNFSVRWSGKIQPRFSGTYTFYINSDNGRRLWVNNQLIIDKWLSDYDVEYSGTVSMAANQLYDIKLEYFDQYGGAGCKLEWMSESQPREVVPKNRLYTSLSSAVTATTADRPDLAIYPNPVRNKLLNVVVTGSDRNETVPLTLIDLLGKTVLKTNLDRTGQVSLTGIAAGTYLLSANIAGQVITKRIAVQ